MDNTPGVSKNGLDYAFGMYTGIFLASTVIFAGYCAVMKNRPRLHKEMILPSLGGGFIWALAQTFWFLGNGGVSLAVSFPLVALGTRTPFSPPPFFLTLLVLLSSFLICHPLLMVAIIAALWGVFLFGENRGKRNIMLLLGAGAFGILSVTCTTLSKVLTP